MESDIVEVKRSKEHLPNEIVRVFMQGMRGRGTDELVIVARFPSTHPPTSKVGIPIRARMSRLRGAC